MGKRVVKRPPRKPVKKCATGKHRFHDKIAALLALANVQHADKTHRPKIEKRAYRCPTCKGWHLTSRA